MFIFKKEEWEWISISQILEIASCKGSILVEDIQQQNRLQRAITSLSSFEPFFFKFMHMRVCLLWVSGACRSLRKLGESDPLELELQVAVGCLMCGLPDACAGNRTWALRHNHLSSPVLETFYMRNINHSFISSFWMIFRLHFFIYLFTYVLLVCSHAYAIICVWGWDDNLQETVPSAIWTPRNS